MVRYLTLFVFVSVALVVVVLSVANRHPVTLALDPIGDPPNLALSGPFFLFLFAAFALGGVLGGTATWLRQGRWRQTARAERARARRLQEQVERLERKAQAGSRLPALPGSPGSRDAA